MTEYINDFDEVCLSGSNSTTDRRPATDLELSQRDEIARLAAEREELADDLMHMHEAAIHCRTVNQLYPLELARLQSAVMYAADLAKKQQDPG